MSKLKINPIPLIVTPPEVQMFWANPDVQKAWGDFEMHRKKIRRPMTDRAVELNKEDLQQLSGLDTAKAVEIMHRSIKNGRLGLFKLRS